MQNLPTIKDTLRRAYANWGQTLAALAESERRDREALAADKPVSRKLDAAIDRVEVRPVLRDGI